MKKHNNHSRKRRRSSATFNPSHNELEIAIDQYLNQGGKINKINMKDVMNRPLALSLFINEADEFLLNR